MQPQLIPLQNNLSSTIEKQFQGLTLILVAPKLSISDQVQRLSHPRLCNIHSSLASDESYLGGGHQCQNNDIVSLAIHILPGRSVLCNILSIDCTKTMNSPEFLISFPEQ